jgi:AcrR family transcriptional regulator
VFRTGSPLSSARDLNCLSATWRARPASGIRMPAQMPSAPGVSQASCAHRHRRRQPRQIALAPSSAVIVHRSGSRVHTPSGASSSTTASASEPSPAHKAITSLRGVRAVGCICLRVRMTTVQPAADRVAASARSSIERIRDAALTSFAAHGTSATSHRTVAAAAGVSLGLVQHHFATKAGLIEAFDDHVLAVVRATLSEPIPEPPGDSIADVGQRVTRLIAAQPDVVDYVGHALIDGSPLGVAVFDTLVAQGLARWDRRSEQGQTRPGLDPTWGALNPLVLALGTLILRTHIERHLPEPFTTPTQLQRWQNAVNSLLRDGQLRHTRQ